MSSMKIAVSGVAGAGKTTLCNRIANATNLPFIPDCMDSVLLEMGVSNGGELYDTQGEAGFLDWYVMALEQKLDDDLSADSYIADKSVLDHGARWVARKSQDATSVQYDHVKELLAEGADVYDRVLYVPLMEANSVAEDNGLRNTNWQHRELVDLTMRGLAQGLEVPLFEYHTTHHRY